VTPPGGQRPVAWFLDTASLISMAIDPQIESTVYDEIAATRGKVVLVDVVKGELEYRASQPETAELASRVLESLGRDWNWLATAWIDTDAVKAVQGDVADGRALKDEYEHWAESVIILLCQQAQARGSALTVYFLTEDFDARRVAKEEPSMTPLTLHRLLYNRVLRDATTADRGREAPRGDLPRVDPHLDSSAGSAPA
jgi:hypothetical protein